MSQSCLYGFSLKILSRSSLQYVGIRGIYTGVCLCVWNAKGEVCNKQSGLVTWPRNLTESQV